jgi:cell division septation protein DedD
MDGILSDMRALVTATRRFVLAAAGEVTRQARVSAHVTELGASSGGAPEWREDDEPRELERGWETRDDLPIEGDDTEDTKETEEVASSGPRHGIWIAAGTFVPTFLTIVLGATYLAGLPMGTRLAPVGKGDPQPVVSVVGSPRGSVDTQRQADAPTMETAGGADKPSRVPSPSTREALDKAAVPATTWVRCAAFPDRDSAERLAARIEQEGYPSRVRRDGTSATAWVVWIAKHPRGRTPAERRE